MRTLILKRKEALHMFNLNNIPVPEVAIEQNASNKKFPTVGLKSILEGSDLLELLLNPSSSEEASKNKTDKQAIDNDINDLSSLNFDDLLKPNQTLVDHDYFEYDMSKINNGNNLNSTYGNACLRPNLWEKNEIFQGDQFNAEFLEIDTFLNEDDLNEDDIKFLDHLQSNDEVSKSIQLSVSDTPLSSPKQKDMISPESVQKSVRNIPTPSEPRPKISTLIDQWNEAEMNEMELDEAPLGKKYFHEKLQLQPTLKKSKKQFVPNELKDDKYWSRRNKNNLAAKRSRDTRRFKENQIVIAATYLEHDNETLRKQLEAATQKITRLEKRLEQYETTRNF